MRSRLLIDAHLASQLGVSLSAGTSPADASEDDDDDDDDEEEEEEEEEQEKQQHQHQHQQDHRHRQLISSLPPAASLGPHKHAHASLPPARFVPSPSNRRMGLCGDAGSLVVPSDHAPASSRLVPMLHVCLIAIQAIWQLHSAHTPNDSLATFVSDLLRRSRTNFNTLKLCLFYLHQSRRSIRHRIANLHSSTPRPSPLARSSAGHDSPRDPILSGRKTFLASLMCASKYLQDRNYSNRAWAKISGLPIAEINLNERTFLELIDYQLHVDLAGFDIWSLRLQKLIEEKQLHPPDQGNGHSPASSRPSPPACCSPPGTSSLASSVKSLRGRQRSQSIALQTPASSLLTAHQSQAAAANDTSSISPPPQSWSRDRHRASRESGVPGTNTFQSQTPVHPPSHPPVPKSASTLGSNPPLSHPTAQPGAAHYRRASSTAVAPQRQMATPLISRPVASGAPARTASEGQSGFSPLLSRSQDRQGGSRGSGAPGKSAFEFQTPVRQQSHQPLSKSASAVGSNPTLSHPTSQSGATLYRRASSAVAPHRQMTTPLISRPTALDAHARSATQNHAGFSPQPSRTQDRQGGPHGSSVPRRNIPEFRTPLRRQSHQPNSKPASAVGSSPSFSQSSLQALPNHLKRASTIMAPPRQLATPLISRPTSAEYQHGHHPSSRTELSAYDTPTKVTGIAPILTGINRSLSTPEGQAPTRPRASKNLSGAQRPPGSMTYPQLTFLDPLTSSQGLCGCDSDTLTSGVELRAVPAEEAIRLDREQLEKVAKEKAGREKIHATSEKLGTLGQDGRPSGLVLKMLKSPVQVDNVNSVGRVRDRAVGEECGTREQQQKKDQILQLIEIKRRKELGKHIGSEPRGVNGSKVAMGGLSKSGASQGVDGFTRTRAGTNGGGTPCLVEEAAEFDKSQTGSLYQTLSQGSHPLESRLSSLPTHVSQGEGTGLGMRRYLAPLANSAASIENMLAPVSDYHYQAARADSREGEYRIARMMEQRPVISCGIQDSHRYFTPSLNPLLPTPRGERSVSAATVGNMAPLKRTPALANDAWSDQHPSPTSTKLVEDSVVRRYRQFQNASLAHSNIYDNHSLKYTTGLRVMGSHPVY